MSQKFPFGYTYAVAFTSVLLILAVRFALDPVLGEVSPLILFLIPVAFSAWFGGFGPGLLATVLGCIAGMTLFSVPERAKVAEHGTAFFWLARGLPFLTVGTIISSFASQAERSRLLAERERHVAEQQREQADASEAFLRRLMASSPDCIKVLDLNGNLVSINDNAKAVLEVSDLSPLLGTCWAEWWNADRDTAAAAVETAKAGGRSSFVAFCPTAAGTPKWWDVTVTPIPGPDGRLERVLAVSRDVTKQHVDADAAAERESRLRSMIASAKDYAVISIDLAGNIEGWAGGAEALFGWAESDVIGKPFDVIWTQRDIAAGSPGKELKLAEDAGHAPDNRWHLRADGQERFVVGATRPVLNAAGERIGYVKVCRDETERRSNEQALEDARRRSAAAMIAGEIGTFEWDVTSDRLYGDENFGRMFAVELDSAGAAPLADYIDRIDPDDRERVTAAIERSLQTATDYVCEYRINTPGQKRWVLARGRMVCDETGRVARFPGVVLDISDRKEAELELANAVRRLGESEAAFRQIADAMPQIVWAARPDGEVDYYNRWWYDYTGLPGEGESEVGETGYAPVMLDEDLDRVRAVWPESWRTGKPYEIEYRFRRSSDGMYRWHLGRAVPIRDETGRIVRWIGTNTDIHDRKMAAEALQRSESKLRVALNETEQASRLKDDFLATISHELRTPLSAITGWATLLPSVKDDPAMLDEGIDVINRNAAVQTQLIEDILDVSRITTGKVRLTIKQLDLRTPIKAAIDTVSNAAKNKGITIETEYFDGRAEVAGDADRLQQVFWNLLSNAIKFTDRGGRIVVRLGTTASRLTVAVVDDGKGIDSDFLPYVFDRFRQADMSSTRRQGGLGLGLAIVRQLVELHGGTITVSSEGAGKGSAFIVDLPFVAVDATTYNEHHATIPRRLAGFECYPILADARVLVVDDEPDARRIIQATLAHCGADVVTVGSVADALGILTADRTFDAVLSDIGMPGEDGYALIRRFKEQAAAGRIRNLPVAALTAFSRESDKNAILNAGFNQYMAKPVSPADLLRTVSEMVALCRNVK